MANTTFDEWEAFRRYGYKELQIEQTPSDTEARPVQIIMRQKNSYSSSFATVGMLVMLAIVLVPTIYLFVTAARAEMAIYALAYLVVSGAIAIPLCYVIGYLAKRYTTLAFTRGYVRLENGNNIRNLAIKVENITSIDVRSNPGGTWHYVCIWDGPHSFDTLSARSRERAMTMRSGVIAALAVFNKVTPSVQPAPVRGFAE